MKPALRPLAALLAAVTLASPATAIPTTWKVDPAHTEVGFEVRHFFSKVHGVFHDAQGTIVFDEQDPNGIKVDATARVASVDTGNHNRDAHLQTPDFFNAASDSLLSFRSTKVEKVGKGKYKISGDLTMRGGDEAGCVRRRVPGLVRGEHRGQVVGLEGGLLGDDGGEPQGLRHQLEQGARQRRHDGGRHGHDRPERRGQQGRLTSRHREAPQGPEGTPP
jgi:hypothetical protein